MVSMVSFYHMLIRQMKKKVYKDQLLAESVVFGTDWQELDLNGQIRTERDVEMIALVLPDSISIPYGSAGIINEANEEIVAEILLVDDVGKTHTTYLGNIRGTRIAGYRFSETIPDGHVPVRVLFRANIPFEARQLLWTSYNISDRK